MRSRMMIGVGVALALTACEQTEVREITEDRYLPQPMDTVKITDNYYLDGYKIGRASCRERVSSPV